MLDKLRSDLKNALKNSEKDKLVALRNLVSKIKTKEIEKGETLSDDECLKVCMSSAKQIKDSIAQFEKGNRQDLADKEKIELDIITQYLPDQLSDDKIINIIKKNIKDKDAKGPSDMGKVMGPIMAELSGKADGSHVKQLLLKELNK